ncbi:hypothetical protein AAG570_011562, partial [Ranatra chinensis]
QLVTLEEGSSVRDVWVKLPQNLTFSVYLFNITNPNQVENGAIPVVNEVGPYVYQEIREKVDLADDLDEDTVTFSGKTTWYFDGDKSHPLTGKEVVTVPHLPLLAVLLMAEIEFPAVVLGGVNAAMPDIYGSPASLFMRVTARQIMFDGVPLDCSSRSPLARTVCAVIKRNSKSLQIVAPNKYKFSIFGIRNGTAEPSRMTVKRGRDDSSMVGRLVMVDGQTSSRVWPEQGLCNKFRGTDSTIFPPFRKPNNTSVVAYSTELCRSLSGVFEKEDSYKGIKGFKYVLVLADPSEPSQQCYCRNIGKCYKRGTAELNDCLGAPLVASLPHFYAADETYSRGVIGLTPDKEKHETSLLLEPTSGTPLQIRKRLQGNIHIHPVRFVNLTGRLTPTLVPIFWAEEVSKSVLITAYSKLEITPIHSQCSVIPYPSLDPPSRF